MYSMTSTNPPNTVLSAAGQSARKAIAIPITAKNSIEPKVSALMNMAAERTLALQMSSVVPWICLSSKSMRRSRCMRSSLAPAEMAV
ncbi:Uncharacterised protein [Klebsiella pneumoniae]|nr:Uncharacterised protein [Klebsiella pneumoniae]